MTNYTTEKINALTNEWLNGSSKKSDNAWKKLLKVLKRY